MEVPRGAIKIDRYWLVIDCPTNPTIRLDARTLDRLFATDDELVLAVDTTVARVLIGDGPTVANSVAQLLMPFTRSAQITRREAYEDAKRRLELASRNLHDNGALVLFVGSDDVFPQEKVISIGKFRCWVSDVELYARAGADLPLPRGVLPADLALLIIAAHRRREDVNALARRVAEYEMTTATKHSV